MVNLPIWQVNSKQDKIQVVKNKKGVTDREARGDKDVFPSSSFLGEYVSLEGCEFQTQDATNGLTLFSDEPCPKARFTFHYWFPFGRKSNPLQQSWGSTHKRIGCSQVTTKGQLATKGLDHKRSQSPSRVQWPKSNKLTNFHFHESSWREQTDATKCNGKNTRSVQVLHSQIPTKQQMLMGE